MKSVLDIATILGGIAALWFFWKEISSLRLRRPSKESSVIQPTKTQRPSETASLNRRKNISSRLAWRREENSGALSIIGAVSGMFSGGLGWLVGVKYGLLGIGISFLAFLIAVAVDISFEKDDKEHPLVHAIVTGIASSFLTAIISAISLVFTDVANGALGIIFGVLIGSAYGFRYGDGDPLKFPF